MPDPTVAVDGASPHAPASINGYTWMITSIAALGGLLFGYNYVVIGGARQFFLIYFHLVSAATIALASSSMLIGCFAGSLAAGHFSSRYGRRPVLLAAAVLFAVSSILTGWSYSFVPFILWQIAGGVAIGLASNVSPVYIAEVSPARHRGRLVSLNQLALVAGIVLAQVVNMLIARPVPEGASPAELLMSWNVQYGWRWMYSAIAVPAIILLVSALRIPESPSWLLSQERVQEATGTLARIGGSSLYAQREVESIQQSLAAERGNQARWSSLLHGRVPRILAIGIVLAVLQQWSGINIFFNYAGEVYRAAGLGGDQIFLDIVVTGTTNLIFTVLAMFIVDRLGRRPIMIAGCLGIALFHILTGIGYHAGWHGVSVLVLTLGAIACYAMLMAPLTWVLISEIFPNKVRSLGVSVAISVLWISSFALTYSFPFIQRSAGSSGAFFLYGAICLAGAVFVALAVPETKGRTLEEIEAQSA